MARNSKASPGKTTRKPKAMSLHLGLNAVSPAHYGGWSGDLTACEFDAKDMAGIAKIRGMKATALLTKNATRAKVLAAMRSAARQLQRDDLFFLTYSGHGGQVTDITGEEVDKKDETWCLYDCQLIDDELYLELSRFAAGVRILVLSDSCHSGTVTRDAVPQILGSGRSKQMPLAVAMRTYRDNQKFYDDVQLHVAKAARKVAAIDPDAALAHANSVANVAASNRLSSLAGKFGPAVILISGCQDNQTSMDGDHNGAFTEQLLRVWNNGSFAGNYAKFHATIVSRMPASQSPNLFTLGATGRFIRQAPFKV